MGRSGRDRRRKKGGRQGGEEVEQSLHMIAVHCRVVAYAAGACVHSPEGSLPEFQPLPVLPWETTTREGAWKSGKATAFL